MMILLILLSFIVIYIYHIIIQAWVTAPTWSESGTLGSSDLPTYQPTGAKWYVKPTHRCIIKWTRFYSSYEMKWNENHPTHLSTHRGFNTFSGYYTGAEHYFSHVRDNGYDFRRNDNVDFGARGNYSTDLFNQEAVSILISSCDSYPAQLHNCTCSGEDCGEWEGH